MPSGIYKHKPRISKSIEKDILKLYKKNYNGIQITKTLKCSIGTVWYYFKKNNIKIKYKRNPKYPINSYAFSKYTPEACYWAGLLAADGNIYHRKDRNAYILQIPLQDRDIGHLKEFIRFLKTKRPIYKTPNKTHLVLIENRILCMDLMKNFDITPRKSLTIQYPTQIPERFNKCFIRGVFDGDGCLHKAKADNQLYFKISGASLPFLQKIQEILINRCSLNKTKILKNKQSNCYSLIYSGNKQVPRIMEFLNVPFSLQRKNIN